MHASGVRAEKKRTSEQYTIETFNQQGFKAHAKNVLLWLRISAVSCESNSILELKLDVNVCGVVQYIGTAAPEPQLIECTM